MICAISKTQGCKENNINRLLYKQSVFEFWSLKEFTHKVSNFHNYLIDNFIFINFVANWTAT